VSPWFLLIPILATAARFVHCRRLRVDDDALGNYLSIRPDIRSAQQYDRRLYVGRGQAVGDLSCLRIDVVFLLLSFVAGVPLLSQSRWNVARLDCDGGDSVMHCEIVAKGR
jgi:hypothetical protein